MMRFKKLPDNIQRLFPEAEVYLQSHPAVVFAYLFGSLAKRKPTPLSDVDIAIFLTDGVNVAETKLGILGRLTDIIQTDEIDLVVLNTANLPLINYILKNHQLIVDKKPFDRHLFESLAMRKYFDFSIKESAMLKRRYLNG
jgi:predicted nucleotidyltransferase